jgi:hypothetical protein
MVMVRFQAKQIFQESFVLVWLYKYYLKFKGLTQIVNHNESFYVMFDS